MPLLTVDDLSVGYRTRSGFITSVDGVSFSLNRGKSLGFVGESGCGKTTIGMALMRLLPTNALISHGRVMFDKRDLLNLSEAEMRQIRWKRIAMIFQAAMNALNPVHRVGDQILEAIMAHDPDISVASATRQVEKLFDLVGITPGRMRDFPHNYSGGMKQRVVIAMALACNPDLIIADEPTTALDVIVQSQILAAIQKLRKELDIGLIFISHDIAVVANVCDSINIMYAGQVIETGRREEVFSAPMHPYTKSLLASYLNIDGKEALQMPHPGNTADPVQPLKGCRFCNRCPVSSPECGRSEPKWIEVSPTHKVMCDRC